MYESSVAFDSCQFVGAKGEDALNLISCDFELSYCDFYGSESDSCDSDFSKGKIISCRFDKSGDDAIDLSGSSLDLKDVTIDGFVDKGISIGESSTVFMRELKIKNGNVAIACKDLSDATVHYCEIHNCEIGLSLYQKKKAYGPSALRFTHSSFENVETTTKVERGCVLLLGKNVKK